MEHLETDVMRFMAILAFCLVAIFALVQSAEPVDPVPQAAFTTIPTFLPPAVPATEKSEERPGKVEAAEVVPGAESWNERPDIESTDALHTVSTQAVDDETDAAEPEDTSQQARVAESEPRTETETPSPATADIAKVASGTESTESQSFSLRFASDPALIGLVERGEVALYAFSRDDVWRFMIVDGRPAFRSARPPGQYHEMTPETVPAAVLRSLRRSVVLPPGTVKWGVTLPPPTAAALARVIATNQGGDLVIDADGYLQLEDSS